MNRYQQGSLFALAAYVAWGISPIYFKLMQSVDALDILSHRIVWTGIILLVLISVMRQWQRLRSILSDLRVASILLITAILIGANWLIFVYAIQTERIAETSLGYYINPLLSLLLARLVLKEHLRRPQLIAIGLGILAVANEVYRLGSMPWIALALATTFAVYGLLRKQLGVGGVSGLFIEVGWLTPLALGWAIHGTWTGQSMFMQGDIGLDLMFIMAGVVTAFPLVLFSSAVIRIPLSTISFYQYIAPTLSLILAVLIYTEPFEPARWLTFGLIFTAVGAFMANEYQMMKDNRTIT